MNCLRQFCLSVVVLFLTLWPHERVFAQAPDPTLKGCQDEVNTALAVLVGNYKSDLQKLLKEFQAAGDLDSYLVVRDEIARFDKTPQIPSSSVVKTPGMLAILQGDHRRGSFLKTNEAVARNLGILLPRQRALTREGKIDDALAVRSVVMSIQSAFKESLDWGGTVDSLSPVYEVGAGSLILGYYKIEDMANRLFTGKRILVEGTISSFDQDFSNGTHFNVFMKDEEGNQNMVQFVFKSSDVDIKRTRPEGIETASFTKKGDATKGPFTMKAGMRMKIEGLCTGKHLHVNMADVVIPDGYWPVLAPAE